MVCYLLIGWFFFCCYLLVVNRWWLCFGDDSLYGFLLLTLYVRCWLMVCYLVCCFDLAWEIFVGCLIVGYLSIVYCFKIAWWFFDLLVCWVVYCVYWLLMVGIFWCFGLLMVGWFAVIILTVLVDFRLCVFLLLVVFCALQI